MEPYYDTCREAIVTASQTPTPTLRANVHLYTGLYCSALARVLCGKGYAARDELVADVNAMRWCHRMPNGIQTHDHRVQASLDCYAP